MTELEKKKWFESEEFEDKYTYTGSDLGITYTKESTTFKVWAPTAEKVMLKLYLQEVMKRNQLLMLRLQISLKMLLNSR